MTSDDTPNVNRRTQRSITAFLTEGSLSRLCDALTRLTGLDVQLRDERGSLVLPGDGDTPWRIDEDAEPIPEGADVLPIVVDEETIGSLVVAGGEQHERHGALVDSLRELAAASAEACRHVVELEHRVGELDVLHELLSLLVRAKSVERVLQIALDSAIRVFGLDAGSIVLFRDGAGPDTGESEHDIETKASRGLSDPWLSSAEALSKDRAFDRMAIDGQTVAIDDLLDDDRVRIRERVEAEGVRSFISTGMVFSGKPIGVVRLYGRTPRHFSEREEQLLVSIGQQASLAVEQARLLEMQRRERRMQAQLKIASDVQRRMMPERSPSIAGIDVAAKYAPTYQLGGDFYDLFEHDGRLVVALGDVVGKGVAAALLMASIRTALRVHVEREDDLSVAMNLVNRGMVRDTLDNEFATLWCGAVNRDRNRIRYVSAGHDPALLRHADGTTDLLPTDGLVVGIDPDQVYHTTDAPFSVGDTLVVYSDGVTDALSFEGERFKRDGLVRAVSAAFGSDPDPSAEAVLKHIRWEMRQFRGLNAQNDDETLVVVRLAE
jgi:sigma-B regulation protein RsbU (phosphoserine phosphatase)